MDTDSFILSIITKDIIKDSKNLEDISDLIIWMTIMKYLVTKTKSDW